MIVDFRVRPPYGGYLNTHMYRNRERPAWMAAALGHKAPRALAGASWEVFLEEFDASGIDMAVVPGRRAEPSMGDVPNEDIARLVEEGKSRFVGFAAVKEGYPEAADELEHAVRDLGLRGLALDPGYADQARYADDAALKPLYDRARELKIPVMITLSCNAGPDIGYANPVPVDRVAASYPDLQIVIAHGGWPWTLQTLAVAFRRPNVWVLPDLYAVNMPGVQDYVDAANGFLRERLMYGSTYPFLPLEGALESYRALPFRPEVLEGILGGNAARLLQLR